MIYLRKKLRLLLLLSFFYQPNIFADIEYQYRNQKGAGVCSYENSQFYSLNSDDRYCVSGGFWKNFYSSGYSYSEGVLNRSLKNVGLFGSNTITKYKIEGNDLVRYSCKGTFDDFDFDCIGPVDRKVMGSRGRKGVISQMDRKFNQTSDKSIAYYNRGIAKNKINDYSGAIDDYTNAIKLDPNDANAYNNRGIPKYRLKDYEGAIDDYTNAIKLDPNKANAYNNRGIVKNKINDYSGAIDDYTNAIKLDPNYAKAYYNRGLVKDTTGDYSGAIDDYTNAIKLDPNYAKAYNNRGITKRRLKDYRGAIDDFTNAIKLDPNYAKAYNNRKITQRKYESLQKELDFYKSTCGPSNRRVRATNFCKNFTPSQ